jgi:hypothetical protein
MSELESIGMSISEYRQKLLAEREYLTAAYLEKYGLEPEDIVWVERQSSDGLRAYIALRNPELDDVAPEIRRWKARAGTLLEALRAAAPHVPQDAWRAQELIAQALAPKF